MSKIEVTGTLMGDGEYRGVLFRSKGAEGLNVEVGLARATPASCVFTLAALEEHDSHSPGWSANHQEPEKNLDALRVYVRRVLEEAAGKLVPAHGKTAKYLSMPADGIFVGTPELFDTFDAAWPAGADLPGTVILAVD